MHQLIKMNYIDDKLMKHFKWFLKTIWQKTMTSQCVESIDFHINKNSYVL